MENIETLLAAVAQTQGLEDDGPAVKTGVELGPENSEAPSVDVPAPARALAPAPPAAGQVIDAAVDKKKKRGWPKGQTRAKPPPRKRIKPENEEDVCFICFDGGSLVLCDRKGCPKAYHPACIKRDEAFFQSKAKWNCGWHICSVCRKTSHYLCYTCTYSLCKGCTKDADYVCVRGNKGFCTICMKTIMLIENKDQANTESVDFDDQTSWEYLFKVYWVILKEKFSLTLDELIRAKNPCKSVPAETALPSTGFDVKKTDNDDIIGVITPGHDKDTPKPIAYEINNETSIGKDSEWATKDLLEFVSLVKKGEKSVISQFDLQTLLLDYIKKNNLRDPHRKSQIVCNQRLRNLFGKPRVGHIEMLKLLEHHSIPPGLVSSRTISRKRKTSSKKCEERAPQQNNDSNEYCAAIDVHNINLIYLRRNVLEKLIDDRESFESKVIGSIVRIKISSDDQKLEVLHRLVQVVGTSKVLGEPYKVGSRTTDFMLEVLNLDKKEVVSIDAVSNQEFTEEECKRLRQSMKCGLVKHFTVGEIRNKAMALQPVRVDDMLKSPEERSRRISEIPEVHLDPKMNLNYESEKDTKSGGVSKADENVRPIDSDLPPQNGKKKPISSNKKDKEERIVGTRNRVRKKIKSGESSCIKKDQALQSSVLETSPAIASVENLQPTSIIETENLWHYRDPNSKIQGPFSMIQLRKWSTTGLFPPDMRIWTNHEQYDSLLLTDCLAVHLASDTSHSGTQNEEEVPAEEIGVLSEGTNVNSGDSNQTKPGLASNTGLTSKKNAEPVKEDASGSWPQCWDLLKDDDNDHNNNNNNDDDDARACDLLPSSSPEKIHLAPANLCQESESENGEKSEIGPLKNPIIPMQNLESQSKNEECAHVPSESGPINKHNPPKPAKIEPLPVEIQVPIHNFEILELLSPTPRSNNENPEFMNFPDSNPAQMWSNPSGPGLGGEIRLPGFEDSGGPDPAPAPSNSNWLTISETIEFDSLGEEYVSDLLAEVDAMESQQRGTRLPSPTAAIKFARELMEDCRDDDDCFSSIEEFSRQSSAWSSKGGEEAPAKPAVSMFDFLTRSSVHSSVSSEGGEITTNKVNNNNNDVVGLSGLDGVQGNINLVTVQGNVNLVLGGPTGLGGWGGTGQGTGWVGPTSMNAASPRDGSQRKYGGGYVRGRLPWGGAYNNTPTRPMHKGGQRACKFYESGHCKKGAFCDYLHP